MLALLTLSMTTTAPMAVASLSVIALDPPWFAFAIKAVHITAAAWLLSSTRLRIGAQVGALVIASSILPTIACGTVSALFEVLPSSGNTVDGATWSWRIGPILALLLGGALLARRPGGNA